MFVYGGDNFEGFCVEGSTELVSAMGLSWKTLWVLL